MPTVLVAQRVRVLTKDGPVVGVIGQKPPHLTDAEERKIAPKLKELWIDIGAADGEEARKLVGIGDLAVLEQPVMRLQGQRLASRAVDDRTGAFVAAESVRLYADSPGPGKLVGVASVQEETNFGGAHTAGYAIAPDAAIVVDVTHCSDYSGVKKTEVGDVRLSRGPVINRGSGVHSALTEFAIETARAEGIPFQVEAAMGRTYTDADAVALSRAGRSLQRRQHPQPVHALAERDRRSGRPGGHRGPGRRHRPPPGAGARALVGHTMRACPGPSHSHWWWRPQA